MRSCCNYLYRSKRLALLLLLVVATSGGVCGHDDAAAKLAHREHLPNLQKGLTATQYKPTSHAAVDAVAELQQEMSEAQYKVVQRGAKLAVAKAQDEEIKVAMGILPVLGVDRVVEDILDSMHKKRDQQLPSQHNTTVNHHHAIVNHHQSWPRVCEMPLTIYPEIRRIVGAMEQRAHAVWKAGVQDPLAGHHPQNGKTSVEELAHAQACLYSTLDAWTQLARAHNIRWAACGGSLFGAHCYHAMPLWDNDIDISVPQEDCASLDRIWSRAKPTKDNRKVSSSWAPRRLSSFGLTVWRATTGEASTNGHTKFTVWDPTGAWNWPVLHSFGPRRQPLISIDVMCSRHQSELVLPGGKIVEAMTVFTESVLNYQAAPVEFGPTTILQVPRQVAFAYIKTRKWDISCGEMPPLRMNARSADGAGPGVQAAAAAVDAAVRFHVGDGVNGSNGGGGERLSFR